MSTVSTRRTAALVAAALVLPLTACTTTVRGTGRPDARPSAVASDSASPTNGLPSGAPPPGPTTYPDVSPVMQAYLQARDATYRAAALAVSGTYRADGPTVTVDGKFAFDTTKSTSVAQCTLTAGGAAGEVRGTGESTWARAPGAFWTAFGADAAAAAKAANRWVKLSQTVTGVAACNNDVFFLGQFEPENSDDLSSDAGNGTFTVTDATTGVTTSIDQDSGRITGIRTKGGDLTFSYDVETVPVVPPSPAEVVTVPGI